ncbi:redox-sensing transcriptional repressor Rex [Tuberibacillus sp. Marseille-P3662]|uniref:redox-sensing transcriptional repressor Rex n=1 Tax=Tuberibacillus sp. Marseille-P3662 TaxID=1965358 RepID=UPI000A1C962B|nr:redox-sensing transcriptional repressor Rex [Tuberibacillus sp. Marseille-P3662]
MSYEQIPRATAKRLPLYYRSLRHLAESGKSCVSSSELSDVVKIDSATIRRDFSYFGTLGKKGYGYNVERLLDFLRETLDQDELTEVMLVGVGNLGTALLNYNFMKNNSTQIVKAYDVDGDKIGTEIAGVTIDDLRDIQAENGNIPVAILTVPAAAAQKVADQLVAVGINGILNFTPVRLSVPDHIRVHHIDLAVELQSIIYFLKNYPLK